MRFPKKNSPKKSYHLKHAVLKASMVMMISLALGILGYHYTEKLEWIDSLLNASMILGGMGPVNEMHSLAGKLFASFYALYSCFVALGIITIMMAPSMHNALRRFHLDPDNKYPPS